LKQCIDHHGRCESAADVPLPRRVVDLEALDSETQLKLHETDNEIGRYMRLSHYWGDFSYPAKTTSLTLNQNKTNIPWASLPKTLQDVITFTRSLKIRFLWIDSLRIIQDSKKDWAEEAPKMVDTYQKSFLTIAAASFSSGDKGCFSTISPQNRAQRLQGQCPDGKSYSFSFRTPLR
jgi:hypothetical protein